MIMIIIHTLNKKTTCLVFVKHSFSPMKLFGLLYVLLQLSIPLTAHAEYTFLGIGDEKCTAKSRWTLLDESFEESPIVLHLYPNGTGTGTCGADTYGILSIFQQSQDNETEQPLLPGMIIPVVVKNEDETLSHLPSFVRDDYGFLAFVSPDQLCADESNHTDSSFLYIMNKCANNRAWSTLDETEKNFVSTGGVGSSSALRKAHSVFSLVFSFVGIFLYLS